MVIREGRKVEGRTGMRHSTVFPFFLDILTVILYNVKDEATIIIFHADILTIII